MKVMVVTNLFPPIDRGGSERVARLSAQAFARAGHDVVVLTAASFSGVRSLWPRRTREDGLTIYRWFPLNLYFYERAAGQPAVWRLLWTVFDTVNIHSYVVARLILRRERPDLVISHNLKGLGYTLARACARGPRRYMHILHDVQLAYPTGILYPATYRSKLKHWPARVYMALTRWMFARVPVVAAPSQWLLDFYRQLGFFQTAIMQVLPNPVADVAYAPLPHEGINILFFELEAHKGVGVLLEAWQGIAAADVTLNLVGGGRQQREIATHTAGDRRVRVRGRLNEEDNEQLWSTADIVVVPSLCLENAPTVIAEALARGVAVVASDVGGIRELTRRASGTVLVPPGDAVALRKALISVVMSQRAGNRPTPVGWVRPAEYAQQLIALGAAA